MTTAAFDTHSSVKTLTASGMPEAQAEAVTELFKAAREANLGSLATKVDLAQVKADLQRDIAEVRADLQRDTAEVRADLQRALAETKADILKWTFGMIGGAVVVNGVTVVAAMVALVPIIAR